MFSAGQYLLTEKGDENFLLENTIFSNSYLSDFLFDFLLTFNPF